MASIAIKNLLHEKVRFAVTLTGIVFSIILTAVQLGIFLGFIEASTGLIGHSKADLWIISKGVTHVEQGVAFDETNLYRALETAGVASANMHITTLGAQARKPDGSDEGVTLVGFDLDSGMGGPWNIVSGSIDDLRRPDAIMVDELYAANKLGVTRIGQVIELNSRRARVVGFTRGIRIFTSQPAIFTSYKNAQRFIGLREDQGYYVLVKLVPGADPAIVANTIGARIKDAEVLTRGEFVFRQGMYWVIGTGAGITVLVAAVLAIIVGVVIVAQTIYSATVDHIREYGTLKAIGATNSYLYRIILTQSVVSGLIAYVIGIAISLVISSVSMQGTLAIIVHFPLAVTLFILTIAMCCGASIVAIRKATTIDPAMVFRG
ncbi:MAG: FtsX-like permease family protein [Acidobacteria bacterium]|nr:FtsX-like permease family protein [Acidobacteriota bacterium]MCW5949780.1 FtsX-like permease family protein [Pyrinomonadaceae bacterium]